MDLDKELKKSDLAKSKAQQVIDEQRIKIDKERLELDIRKNITDEIFTLTCAASMIVVDEEKTTIGSEPALKLLFTPNEILKIKQKILKNLSKL